MHISEFRTFFQTAGLEVHEFQLSELEEEAMVFYPTTSHTVITAVGTNFIFTEAGNFIGAMSDESGYFYQVKQEG